MPYYKENKKLEPWPGDWDLHLIKTCELFFDGNSIPSIRYIDSNSIPNANLHIYSSGPESWDYPHSINCNIYFVCANETYTVMCEKDSKGIIGLIFKNKAIINLNKIKFLPDGNMNIQIKVDLLSNIDVKKPYDCAEMIQAVIAKDYWDNHDNDEEDSVPEPIPTGGMSVQVS